MNEPKFKLDQQVKFVNDHDRMAGKVLSFSYHSANAGDNYSGWEYKISSRYYDAETNEMKDGHKICKEEELVAMDGYTGNTEPIKADRAVNVSDQINPEGELKHE